MLIVQPYVPEYRLPFYERLVDVLVQEGISCTVAAAAPVGDAARRQDGAVDRPWLTRTRGKALTVRGRTAAYYGSNRAQASANAIIVGLLGSSPDTWAAIARRGLTHRRVGVWGHVKSYIARPNALDGALESWQARHVDHVFAYSKGGAAQAKSWGISDDKITTVMNSVDVQATSEALDRLHHDEVQKFAEQHQLTTGHTAGYIGGLDGPKRIDFLAAALDQLWDLDRGFRLLTAGHGAQEHLLAPAIARGQVVHLGFARPAEKALIARSVQSLAMPGRIGLIAVESLALGLPLVTAPYEFHAPENEYLVEGVSRFTSPPGPAAFAALLLDVTGRSSERSVATARYPTLDEMVGNFRRGILSMLS